MFRVARLVYPMGLPLYRGGTRIIIPLTDPMLPLAWRHPRPLHSNPSETSALALEEGHHSHRKILLPGQMGPPRKAPKRGGALSLTVCSCSPGKNGGRSYLSVQRLPEPHHACVRLHSKEAGGLLPRHTEHKGIIVHVSSQQLGHRRTWSIQRRAEDKNGRSVHSLAPCSGG